MPFTKGTPKPKGSGRGKGTKNREHSTVHERVKKLGHDPIRALVELAQEAQAEGDRPVALQANKELLSYMYPKLRSIEHQVGNASGTVFEVNMIGIDPGQPIEGQAESVHTYSSVPGQDQAGGPEISAAEPQPEQQPEGDPREDQLARIEAALRD